MYVGVLGVRVRMSALEGMHMHVLKCVVHVCVLASVFVGACVRM